MTMFNTTKADIWAFLMSHLALRYRLEGILYAVGFSLLCRKNVAGQICMLINLPQIHYQCKDIKQTLNHANTCTFSSHTEWKMEGNVECLSILLTWHQPRSIVLNNIQPTVHISLFLSCV